MYDITRALSEFRTETEEIVYSTKYHKELSPIGTWVSSQPYHKRRYPESSLSQTITNRDCKSINYWVRVHKKRLIRKVI